MGGLDCASWKTSSYPHRPRQLLHGYRGAQQAAQRPRNRHRSHPWRNTLEIVHHRRQCETGETDRSYNALDQETCCLLPGMPLETGEATVSYESPALNEHRIAALVPYDIVRPSGTRVCRSTLSLLQELVCVGEPKFQAWVLYQRSDKDPLPCRTRTKELGWVLR